MLRISSFFPSDFYHQRHKSPPTSTPKPEYSPQISLSRSYNSKFPLHVSLSYSTLVTTFEREEEEEEEAKVKWHDVGPDITAAQKQAISQLPPKMTNRCKALMKRILCFSEGESLSLLLAAWVKVMNPRRADWLAVLKELKRFDNPLHVEVMECALLEESFEANVRDYTKLIDTYAKQNRIGCAKNTFETMKSRGFPCDQVTLTVLIHMYSKSGNLNHAVEAFEQIKLLSLPLDKRAYGSMIMAYVRAGKLNLAENLMREMEGKEIYAGREVYKALLRAYSTTGDADGAQRVFDSIQYARIVPDVKLCALLVNAYCLGDQSGKALSVLENMKSVGLKPCDKCISLMLGAYERENSLDKAVAFLMDLEDGGVEINQEASDILERWFQKLGVVDVELQHVLRKLTSENTARSRLENFSEYFKFDKGGI